MAAALSYPAANLDWSIDDDGMSIEINSEYYSFSISLDNELIIFNKDGDYLTERKCRNMGEAEDLADCFERLAINEREKYGRPYKGESTAMWKSLDAYGTTHHSTF